MSSSTLVVLIVGGNLHAAGFTEKAASVQSAMIGSVAIVTDLSNLDVVTQYRALFPLWIYVTAPSICFKLSEYPPHPILLWSRIDTAEKYSTYICLLLTKLIGN